MISSERIRVYHSAASNFSTFSPFATQLLVMIELAQLYFVIALFLLINLLIGLIGIAAMPTRAERLLAAQLIGTTTAAILLLLADSLAIPALRDVALLFTLLAALISVAFVRLAP